jgi:hypothetical protein
VAEEDAITWAQKELDIELMPWQETLARAILNGDRIQIYHGGKASGRMAVAKVVEKAREHDGRSE